MDMILGSTFLAIIVLKAIPLNRVKGLPKIKGSADSRLTQFFLVVVIVSSAMLVQHSSSSPLIQLVLCELFA